MDQSRHLTRNDKAKLRKLQLEKWREEKARKNLELKKNKRPPLRPAGKSSIFTSSLTTSSKVVKAKLTNSKMKSFAKKTAIGSDTKVGSTVYSYASMGGYTSSKKAPKDLDTTFSLEDNEELDFEQPIHSKIKKRKSVQFKERPEEITTSHVDIPKDQSLYGSPNMNEQSRDDIRRRSYAGRTPFSCASSRSGSTPGRRDLPPHELNDVTDQSFGTPCSLKPKKRRNKGSFILPPFKYSFSNSPFIEREPYMLRVRTPKFNETPLINTTIRKTPGKSNIKAIDFVVKSTKKKRHTVSFRDDVINSPPVAPLIFNLQNIIGDKENVPTTDINDLTDREKSVSSTSGLSFLDEKYSDPHYLLRSPASIAK